MVDNVLDIIEKHFGKLVITRGKTFNFLGMKIKITKDKTIEMSMKDQIEEAFEMFGEKLEGSVSSPATKKLNTVDPKATQLNNKKSDIFHSVVAKLLFIVKRARPDCETAISFLTRRVSKSDEDDWEKLRRVLLWCKNTINDIRVIGATSLTDVFTWIDAAYAVHSDMRSHTGGIMFMGVGTVHGKSGVQKLSTRSSTEAELVGVSEYLLYNIWIMNFMDIQGLKIKNNILYQDNQSVIRMEQNRRYSCTGNSRQLDILDISSLQTELRKINKRTVLPN